MRTLSRALFGAATTTLVIALAGAQPASAAPTGDTDVTFTLTGGTLDIVVPAAADFADVAVSSPTVSGNLGTVTVNDNRGLSAATWAVSVSSTDFVGSGTAAGTTIPAANISYTPGTITATNVTGTGTPVAALSGTPQPTVDGSAGVGVNTASWDPVIAVTIPPATAVAGDYTATVTQSVA